MSNERFSRKTVAARIAAMLGSVEHSEKSAGRREFDPGNGTTQLRRRMPDGHKMSPGELAHIDRCVAYGRRTALRDLAERLGLSDLMP